jgi:hypothetical protein
VAEITTTAIPPGTRRLVVAWLVVHFGLLGMVCLRETFSALRRGPTLLPSSLRSYWQAAESLAAAGLGEQLPPANKPRALLRGYLHWAGIQSGYGFFAPNVPDSYKLAFEIHYRDGRTEHVTLGDYLGARDLRLASLMDNLSRTESDIARAVMIKLLTDAIWREHRDATMIRAILGSLVLPTPKEYRPGAEESYEFRYAYDFTFSAAEPADATNESE